MKTMRKNVKLILLSLVMFVSLLFAALGLDSFRAFAQTTEPTAENFVMTEGASVRIGKADGKNGIRYQATMPVTEYEALKGNEAYDVSFGVLITFDAYAKIKPLNKVNVFDEATAVYATADEQGKVPEGKAPIANMTAEKMAKDEEKNVMYLAGSIVNINDENIQRPYFGTAYVKLVNKTTSAESYLFATENDNSRSIAYVARKAVDNTTVEPVLGADEKAWLQENYLNKASHVVTFDAGEGANAVPAETVSYGGKATNVTPVRDGYAFEGWLLNDQPYDFNTPVTEAITLTAKWRFVEYSKLSVPDSYNVAVARQETAEPDFVHSEDGYGSKVLLTPTGESAYAQIYYKPATAGTAIRAFVKVVTTATPKFLTNTNMAQYYVTMPMNEWQEIYIPYTNDSGCLLMVLGITEETTVYMDSIVEVSATEYEADTDKLSNLRIETNATLSFDLQPHAYERVFEESSKHSLRLDLGATGSYVQLYSKIANKNLSSGMIYVVNNTPGSAATIDVTENPTVPLNTWTRLCVPQGVTEGLIQLTWTAGCDFTVYFDNLEFADPCLKLTDDEITALDTHYDGTAGSYHWTTAATDANMHIHMNGKGEGSWSGVYVNKPVADSYRYMTFELKMNVYVDITQHAVNGGLYLAGKQDSTTFVGQIGDTIIANGDAMLIYTYDVSQSQRVVNVKVDLAAIRAAGIDLSEGFTLFYASNGINQAVIYKIRLG